MKALQFPLFWLLASAELFHIAAPSFIPYHPEPEHVCATFPFCYQELVTGTWKSLPGKSQLNTTGTSALSRDVPVDSSECWLDGYYCRSDASNLITRIKLDTAEECQQSCLKEKFCRYFSFHETRGQGYCSLLSECVVNRKCLDSEKCATGGQKCDCQKLDYFPGTKDSSGFSRWTCEGGLDPYTRDTPVGKKCFATCPAWKDSTLQSTCLRNGKWSATAPAARRSLGYAASYPTPDLPDMECGCNEVGLFRYDPNTEPGALFVCDGRDQDEYKKTGGWTIKNTDKCELFCSEAPEPVVSVYCDGATWRGEPERGFWCYDKPETPGPQGQEETQDTKVNGNWGNWGNWASCDSSTGTKKRVRSCDNPTPINGGASCAGSSQDSATCPVNGNWGNWGNWAACDSSTGTKKRVRSCDNPTPKNGGTSCAGSSQDSTTCPGCSAGWERYGSSCFRAFSNKVTWKQAQSACQTENGNLASILDSTTNNGITNLFKNLNSGHMWIGLSRPSRGSAWEWIDKSPLKYESWSQGSPSGDGDCTELAHDGWNDLDCTAHKQSYVCEKSPGMVNPVVLLTGGFHEPRSKYSAVSVEVYSPSGSCNKDLEDIPFRYVDHSVNFLNGEIIICGGQSSSTRCLRLDQNQRFVEHSKLNQGHYYHVGAVVSDTLAIVGGRGSTTVETWNGSQWETKSFPEIEDLQVSACIDAISTDTLLMVGGRRESDWKSTNKLMKYYKADKDQDGVWEEMEAYPGKATFELACAFIKTPEGDSFLVGGYGTSYLYNIQNNKWEEVGKLSHRRGSREIVVVDGRVLMLGGIWGPTTVEEYDVKSKTWSIIEQKIKRPRGSFDAVVVPGALVGC